MSRSIAGPRSASPTAMKPDLAKNLSPAKAAGAILINSDGRVIWNNHQAAVLFATQDLRGHLIGRWVVELQAEDAIRSLYRSPMDDTVVWHCRHDDGASLALEVECSPVAHVAGDYCLLLVRDAAHARQMWGELRMLGHAVMQSDDAVMITAADGTILFVNPAFERESGYTAQEAVGKQPNLVKSGEHQPDFYSTLWRSLRAGEVVRTVFTNRRRNGEIFHEEKTITPVRDEYGHITHFISTGRDVTARIQSEARLEFLANYDVLTGLPNRTLFFDRLAHAIRRAGRSGETIAVLFLDLDRFKTINDSLGHSAGDSVLGQVAERLRSVVRAEDSVARLGGDEFTVIVEGLHRAEDSTRVAEAIVNAFTHPVTADGRTLYIGVSIGIAIYPEDGPDVETLVKHADIAMFRAKASGRCAYVNYSAVMEGGLLEDLSLETSLRSALANGEFHLAYQPIMDPSGQRTLAYEALLRWDSPVHGSVPPARFIPLLEETGMIVAVGKWVLDTACGEILTVAPAASDIVLAVNLSGRQFRDGSLVRTVQEALTASGLPPRRLELEITESILIEDAPAAAQTLDALSGLGIRLAIDDFGTGYSSLSYLRRFPIHTLKIDRSFVAEIEKSPDAVVIVRAIVSLAHNLGLEVVGEGVENAEQLAVLAELGCQRMQGFWFSRPQPAATLPSRQEADAASGPPARHT